MNSKHEFMIVSGNGRNTGKTTFIERVIRKNCIDQKITAIKVSPHFHPAKPGINFLEASSNFNIIRETSMEGNKDSSRMLRAGADAVYYIEVEDEHLPEALNHLFKKEDISGGVICESGGMRRLIEPSIFILLTRNDITENKRTFEELSPLADRIVHFHDGMFDLEPDTFTFTGNKWEYSPQMR